ncbi:MAG: tetratricopeptide repeat protein, partial [Cyclobacteriaceae bacterium]
MVIWIIAMYAPHQTWSQVPQSEIDSLIQHFEGTNSDSMRLSLSDPLLSILIKNKDSIRAEYFINEATQSAKRLDDERGVLNIRLHRAALYHEMQAYEASGKVLDPIVNHAEIDRWLKLKVESMQLLARLTLQQNQEKGLAIFDEALELSVKEGDISLQWSVLLDIGNVYFQEYRCGKSQEYFEQSYELAKKGDIRMKIESLISLGRNLRCLRDLDASLQAQQEALVNARAMNNKYYIAFSLMQIGVVHHELGHHAQALKAYEECLRVGEGYLNERDIIGTLTNLGNRFGAENNFEKAIQKYKEAIARSKGGRLDLNVALPYANATVYFFLLSEVDSAILYADRAVEIYTHHNQLGYVIWVLTEVGVGLSEKGQYSRALDYYYKALGLAEETKDWYHKGHILLNLANLEESQGRLVKSQGYVESAIESFQIAQNEANEALARNQLADLLVSQKVYDRAFFEASQALKILETLGDSCSFAMSELSIGKSYAARQAQDSALLHFQAAKKSAKACNNRVMMSAALLEIGKIFESRTQMSIAVTTYEEALDLAQSPADLRATREAAYKLYPLYKKQGKFKESLKTFEIYHAAHDSLFNEGNTRALAQKEMSHAYEKERQEQVLLQQQEKAIQKQRLLRQTYLTYGFIAAFILMLALVLAVYRNFRNKQKANLLLSEQNHEIEAQRAQLQSQKEELQELDQFKSRFFTNISHELRTPLTLIAGPLEELLNRNLTKDVHHVL